MGRPRATRYAILLALVWGGIAVADRPATADTLEWALVQAYQNNPSLNAQRATLRATDEYVPQALSGYRPKLSVTATGGENYTSIGMQNFIGNTITSQSTTNLPFTSRGVGATATETLYNGLQTANRVRQAESQVMAARETLRVTEQQVLLDAVTAYLNLLRDQAIADLNRRNVEVLTEQLKQTRQRLKVGEVTKTDEAQSESRLAAARTALLAAEANVSISAANYQRIIGVIPGRLAPAKPIDRLAPPSLNAAIAQGEQQSPSVLAAMYGVDVAELAVKISEGALYPNFSLTANASQNWAPVYDTSKQFLASVVGQLTIPIYQGGAEYSGIRQSKETAGQQRLNLDVNRDQARATVKQSWAELQATKAEIDTTSIQVKAAVVALNGVRQEARVGQRTTLDILNAQQELVNARIAVVTAEHDRLLASYALLAAVGSLSVEHLGLRVGIYDPQVHYQQVRDAWFGVRIPNGQ